MRLTILNQYNHNNNSQHFNIKQKQKIIINEKNQY